MNPKAGPERIAELQRIAIDAAKKGCAATLEPMLREGVQADFSDGKGNTLLMIACQQGNLATARLLLERGADTEKRNHCDRTPIAGAACKGYIEMVRLLVSHGADPTADQGGGRLPVDFAALSGHAEIVRYLESVSGSGPSRWRRAIAGAMSFLRSGAWLFGRKGFFFVAGG